MTNNTARPYAHSDKFTLLPIARQRFWLLLHSLDTPVNHSLIFKLISRPHSLNLLIFSVNLPSIVMKTESETPQTPTPAQTQPATQYTAQWGTARAPPLIISLP